MNALLEQQLLSADDVLLVPQLGILTSRSEAVLQPFIFSAPMDTVTGYELAKAMLAENQFPVICREINDEEYSRCLVEFANTPTFFAVGATPLELKRFVDRVSKVLDKLPESTKFNVAIDIAHGDSVVGHTAAKFLQDSGLASNIMSGSICTPAAAIRCLAAGCTFLRIGIGPGSVCTTRMMTGVGVPQLSAVYRIHSRLTSTQQREGIVLIADGGIRYPGDAVKYLAAGADAIMMGSTFSKTKESLGWESKWPDTHYEDLLAFPRPTPTPILTKRYRGHSSREFQQDRKGITAACPEGTATHAFQWQGETVQSVCNKFKGGIASAISYLGFQNLTDLQPDKIEFIQVTTSTYMESMPHNREVQDVKAI